MYIQFFPMNENFQRVYRLETCLKISGRMFYFGKRMNYNAENRFYYGKE